MLYNLLYPFVKDYTFLNLFKYLTFRTGGAILTSLIIWFMWGGVFIRYLKKLQKDGQPIRTDGPESHLLTKKNTPTMGGLLILGTLTLSTILWSDLTNPYVWIVLLVTLGFGFLGFRDDFLKLTKRNTKGVSARGKLLWQGLISIVALYWISCYAPAHLSSSLAVPIATIRSSSSSSPSRLTASRSAFLPILVGRRPAISS